MSESITNIISFRKEKRDDGWYVSVDGLIDEELSIGPIDGEQSADDYINAWRQKIAEFGGIDISGFENGD